MRTQNQVNKFHPLSQRSGTNLFQIRINSISLDREVGHEINNPFHFSSLLIQQIHSAGSSQSQLITFFCQSLIRIVLSQQYTIFGSRRKHSVRLVHPFCYKVINQNTDISLVSSQRKFISAVAVYMRINSRNQSLTARFFITGGTINLSCKKQILHRLCLQGRV